jgi:outer membrane protein
MKKSLIVLFVLAFAVITYSQEKGENIKVYTLDECLKIANQNNPEIRQIMARMGSTSADVTNSFGEFLPSLAVNMGYRRTFRNDQLGSYTDSSSKPNQYTSLAPNYYNLDAGFQYTLFNGFGRENNYNRAKENFNSLTQSIQYTRKKVILDIYRAFVQAVLNKQILKIRQENFNLGLKELEKVKARYEAGVTPVNFVYSQEADLGTRELDVVKAQNDMRIAQANLLIYMGLTPESDVDISVESLPSEIKTGEIEEFRKDINNYESALKTALAKRFDYKATQSSIKSAEYQLNASGSTYWPSLTAQGGWSWSNYFVQDFSKLGYSYIGLNLSIPIFENFRTNLNVENAKLQLESRQIDLFNIEQSIKQALKTSLLNLNASEKQLEITDRSLKSAVKNYDYSNERFRAGASSVSDYFIANNLLLTTQINRITAVYSYFISKKEVLYALGQLD